MEEECLVYRQMTETKRICSLRLLLLLTPYLITAFTSNGRHAMYLTPLTGRRGEGRGAIYRLQEYMESMRSHLKSLLIFCVMAMDQISPWKRVLQRPRDQRQYVPFRAARDMAKPQTPLSGSLIGCRITRKEPSKLQFTTFWLNALIGIEKKNVEAEEKKKLLM